MTAAPRTPLQPDWRWHAVTPWLASAQCPSTCTDPWLRRVFTYRTLSPAQAAYVCPDIDSAHALWATDPYRRALLEGYMLAGATDDDIVSDLDVTTDLVAAYHACFFDVRHRKRHAVAAMVFGGLPHKNYKSHDVIGIMHRLAWFGGLEAIRSVVGAGGDAQHDQICEQVFYRIIRRQLPEVALSFAYAPEHVLETMRVLREERQAAREAQREREHESAVLQHLRRAVEDLRIEVADPHDTFDRVDAPQRSA